MNSARQVLDGILLVLLFSAIECQGEQMVWLVLWRDDYRPYHTNEPSKTPRISSYCQKDAACEVQDLLKQPGKHGHDSDPPLVA